MSQFQWRLNFDVRTWMSNYNLLIYAYVFIYKTGAMWATVLQIYFLVQWPQVVLGTEVVQQDSGLNSMPHIGSLITKADFSRNDTRRVNSFSLSEAIHLKVRHLRSVSSTCGDLWLWASYQIRKIAGCACAGNAGNVFPRRRFPRKSLVSDPGMHHGTCVTHVPWCMSGSLTCGDEENVPGIPGACAPAILRIWQEAHCIVHLLLLQQLLLLLCYYYHHRH